jgi:hypothetical protein
MFVERNTITRGNTVIVFVTNRAQSHNVEGIGMLKAVKSIYYGFKKQPNVTNVPIWVFSLAPFS